MKIKMILLAVSAIVGFAIAQEVTETNAEAAKCKTECSSEKECATKCKTKCDSKEHCDSKKKCATKCKTKCDSKKECASKKQCDSKKKCASKKLCDSKEKGAAEAGVTHFNVSGMTCTGCSKKLTSALSAVKGVEVKKVCHKSGCVDVKLSDGATAEQVQETITKSGFKITPEKKG